MRSSRLPFALENGAISVPAQGKILVLAPREEDDLSALPKARLTVVQGFRPDYDAFVARGYEVLADLPQDAPGSYAAALVCLPRAKAQARGLLAAAARLVAEDGLILVDGQKTDGIDSVLRDLRQRLTVQDPVSKAHGKLFAFRAGQDSLHDWTARPLTLEGGFQTVPGIFSADGPDRGSALLAAALPQKLSGVVVDLGAGWGYLSAAALESAAIRSLHLVEADAAALACARRNVTDARAQFHWADATSFRPDRPVDAVICNPPFHTSRTADPQLGVAFLAAAARMLSPQGTLWMVANRHLPYDRPLATLFKECEDIGTDASFRVIRASKPVRAPR
jgi:16S rRNA (guanine1207-N2)-methyltransferase